MSYSESAVVPGFIQSFLLLFSCCCCFSQISWKTTKQTTKKKHYFAAFSSPLRYYMCLHHCLPNSVEQTFVGLHYIVQKDYCSKTSGGKYCVYPRQFQQFCHSLWVFSLRKEKSLEVFRLKYLRFCYYWLELVHICSSYVHWLHAIHITSLS